MSLPAFLDVLKKSLLVISINLVAQSAYTKVEAYLGVSSFQELQSSPHFMGTLPKNNSDEIIISKKDLIISYDRQTRNPFWVSWFLTRDNFGNLNRKDEFHADPSLIQYLKSHHPNEKAVSETEFSGSCYDRGHMSPSADHTNSPEDNLNSFSMVNISPQTPYLNRNLWYSLEKYSRKLVLEENKKLLIIAGNIFDEDIGSIGPQKNIKIPSKNFKIIYILEADQTARDITPATPTISVIMPNRLSNGEILKPQLNGVCPREGQFEESANISNNSRTSMSNQIASDLNPGTDQNPELIREHFYDLLLSESSWKKYQTQVIDIEKQTGFQFSTNASQNDPINLPTTP